MFLFNLPIILILWQYFVSDRIIESCFSVALQSLSCFKSSILRQSFFDDRIIGCFDVAPSISCCFDPHPMTMPLLFSNYRKLLQCCSSISPWCFKSYYGNPSLIIELSTALLLLFNLWMLQILVLWQCFCDHTIILWLPEALMLLSNLLMLWILILQQRFYDHIWILHW